MTEYDHYSNYGGQHRNTSWIEVWYKSTDGTAQPWIINGINFCIGRLEDRDGYWGIPSSREDENCCKDIGPFESLEVAAVALSLMQ